MEEKQKIATGMKKHAVDLCHNDGNGGLGRVASPPPHMNLLLKDTLRHSPPSANAFFMAS